MDSSLPTYQGPPSRRHLVDPPDIDDKFATLFSPATPRATPTASPRMHPARNLPHPPHMLLRQDILGPVESDQTLLVPVSPAADPLSDPSSSSGTLLSGGRPNLSGNVPQHRPAPHTSSLAFFNTFTNEAKRASELNRKGYLDELLLHEDDPLYWVNEEPGPAAVNPVDDDFGEFTSAGDHTEVNIPHTAAAQVPIVSVVDPIFHLDDVDDRFFQDIKDSETGADGRREPRSSAPTFHRPKQHRSPSLPTMQTISPVRTSSPTLISDLSSSSPSILHDPSQTLLDHSESTISASDSSAPDLNYSTLSNFSSRWMSSLLSSSRISAPSTTPSAHRSLDTLFASHASPTAKSQSARDAAAQSLFSIDASRSQSPTSGMGTISRRQHSEHATPIAVSISHRTPFASHAPFVPPSGAPGFFGDDHSWDRGFSEDYNRDPVGRRSVMLMDRKEGEGCVVVLGVALADLVSSTLFSAIFQHR